MGTFFTSQRYESIIDKIASTSKETGFDAYIVGGFVRDLFIKREPKDLDVMVRRAHGGRNDRLAGINFSKILADKYKLRKPVVFEKFGTAKLFIDGQEVEFVMPRREYYNVNSRNPSTQIASLKQDALRRDFTINALFLRLSDMKILDYTSNGLNDIKNKIIRVADPANAEIIFKQDPLRILRAVRQSLQFGFAIEPDTYNSIKVSTRCISIVSPERIRDEINKILLEERPSQAFETMLNVNLLCEILPEIAKLNDLKHRTSHSIENVFTRALKVLDRTKKDIVLRMAALLSYACEFSIYATSFGGDGAENAKEAKSILKRLKYPKEFIQKTESVIKNYAHFKMHSSNWTDVAVRKFAKNCGGELGLTTELAKADSNGSSDVKKLVALKKRIKDLKTKNALSPKRELLTGDEMIRIFNKPAGKWIKELKDKIEEMRLQTPSLTKEEVVKAIKEGTNV